MRYFSEPLHERTMTMVRQVQGFRSSCVSGIYDSADSVSGLPFVAISVRYAATFIRAAHRTAPDLGLHLQKYSGTVVRVYDRCAVMLSRKGIRRRRGHGKDRS